MGVWVHLSLVVMLIFTNLLSVTDPLFSFSLYCRLMVGLGLPLKMKFNYLLMVVLQRYLLW